MYYKTRIERIVNGDAVCKATQEVIECIQTNFIFAAIVPSITMASS
jgi:hypothetical protein